MLTSGDFESRLEDTKAAFDSVAADYDGPRGNNPLIQDMREEMWRWLDATFVAPSRLIDVGCGTGLDAVRMARRGHSVTATDWSPHMIARTAERARNESLSDRVSALPIGAHELDRLDTGVVGEHAFEGAYSNLGPLNCVPDLAVVSTACAGLIKPGGALVFTVIGRFCPWEIVHYLRRARWSRLAVRFARRSVPVGMNGHTIWTRYYTPREFYRPFARDFELVHHRSLCLFAPPPYLAKVREIRSVYDGLWRLDRRVAGWPILRFLGDHFLIVMRKR